MRLAYPLPGIVLAMILSYVGATCGARALLRSGVISAPPPHRFVCLDGLRGYLALSVMISHFIIWLQISRLGGFWVPPRINVFNNLGAGSVAVFFMITGFLFYPRILAGFSANSWPATYIARLFRILPLTCVSITIVLCVIILRTGISHRSGLAAGLALWLTGWREPPLLGYAVSGRVNAYVLWSLWYEWMFYIAVLPACALAGEMMRGRLPSWSLPIALCAGALLARHFRGLGQWPNYLPLFAIGMIAFECQRSTALRRVFARPALAAPALVCLVAGMMREPTPVGVLQLPLFGFFFIVIACGNDLFGVLRTQGAQVLGSCSFGIYLIHGIVLSVLFEEGNALLREFSTPALPVMLLPAMLMTVCIAVALHYFIEKPAIHAGRLLTSRWFSPYA